MDDCAPTLGYGSDEDTMIALAATAGARAPPARLREQLLRRGLRIEAGLVVRGAALAAGVAIVGARASDPYGLAIAERLAREVVARGLAVISGGAEGCDGAAHEGALAAGGRTIVVLPGGHDHPYPPRHVPMYEQVVATGGTIVSPWWPTTRITRSRFLGRNRVIAQLAGAVVVVRARARSGSLSTAHAAQALGKPVGAVPGAIGETLSEGCHLLLDEGAVPIVGPRSLDELLRRSGVEPPRCKSRWPVQARGQPAPWSEDDAVPDVAPGDAGDHSTFAAGARAVRETIAREPGLDLEAIAVRTGVPISALAAIALGLEIGGVIERGPGGCYHLRQ